MAIGLGKMFGFTFDENFNYPYMSKSITEFWRRWHISLGTWFKEYLYIPLGGNKKGEMRQIFNILVVWSLTGLWHGASCNFAIWGMYFGIFLVLEKMFILKGMSKLSNYLPLVSKVLSRLYTLVAVVISWLIFSITDTNRLIAMLKILLCGYGFNSESTIKLLDKSDIYLLSSNALILIVAIVAATGLPTAAYVKFVKNREENGAKQMKVYEIIAVLVLFFISFAFVVSSTYNPFLYFRF